MIATLSAFALAMAAIMLGAPDWGALAIGLGWLLGMSTYQLVARILDAVEDMSAKRPRDG